MVLRFADRCKKMLPFLYFVIPDDRLRQLDEWPPSYFDSQLLPGPRTRPVTAASGLGDALHCCCLNSENNKNKTCFETG